MRNRRMSAWMAAGVLAVGAMASMPVMAEETTAEASTEEGSKAEAEGAFVLEYPEDMQELGYTEPIVLDAIPERVVSLSAAPVLALYELGVNLVGIPNSSVVTWPEDLAESTETVSFSVMSPDDFDYESVVALEPDLVLLAYNGADTAGATLESLGIPVYYIYAGHTVSYDSIKMQTEVLIDAFAVNETAVAAGEEILQSFSDLEEKVSTAQEAFAGKTVMVLQSGGDSHYIQTNGGTLGSMAEMIGLTNVYENEASSMVQLDYEQALDYNPDLVMCVGATSAEEHQELMEAAFAENPEYWNSISAIAEGNVLYLPVTYVSTAGINVVENIENLIDTVADFYGIEVVVDEETETDAEAETEEVTETEMETEETTE